MAKRKLKVFLSHAPGDLPAARELYRQLAGEGWIDVWFGEERLSPGLNKNREIEQAISDTDSAIVCISKDATTQAGSFQRELRLILDAEQNMPDGTIFLIPLKLEQCEPLFQLREKQFANYFGDEREKAYSDLLRSLRVRAKPFGIATDVKTASVKKTSNADTPLQAPSDLLAGIDLAGDASHSIFSVGNHNHLTINHIYVNDGQQAAQPSPDLNEDGNQ